MYFVTNSTNANNIHINNEINKLMFSRDFNNIILPFLDDLIIANVPAYISSVYIGTTINKITIIGITLNLKFSI